MREFDAACLAAKARAFAHNWLFHPIARVVVVIPRLPQLLQTALTICEGYMGNNAQSIWWSNSWDRASQRRTICFFGLYIVLAVVQELIVQVDLLTQAADAAALQV
ncbi:hypothetical protein AURDEDRAFT_166597 [Auricularia subglabra TFB-10046 SS5]|nr:hypothetical protein AURDEDRAFT_166597 [Auricularia subglabra TFB-10046 SS5]